MACILFQTRIDGVLATFIQVRDGSNTYVHAESHPNLPPNPMWLSEDFQVWLRTVPNNRRIFDEQMHNIIQNHEGYLI